MYKYKLLVFAIFLLFAQNTFAKSSALIPVSNRLFGLTIDESSFNNETTKLDAAAQIENILQELRNIKNTANNKKITVRIVLPVGCENDDDCDGNEKIITNKLDTKYITLMQLIKKENLADIMAELLDSDIESSAKCFVGLDEAKSVACYLDRAKKMYTKLGAYVDIWEIGNEANGDWVGGNFTGIAKNNMRRKIIVAQIKAAYDFFTEQKRVLAAEPKKINIENKKLETAITFYFSGIDVKKHCYENDNDALLGWLQSEGAHFKNKNNNQINFPELDYALISYYPDDNFYEINGTNKQEKIILSAQEWVNLFATVQNNFGGNTQFGLGEVGAQCYFSKKIKNCADCKTLLLDYDTQERNPCDEYDAKGEIKASRKCACCYCAQVQVMQDYYIDLDAQICAAMDADMRFKSHKKYTGGYFNWYYSPDVLNKIANGTAADKEQAAKVRQAIIEAFKMYKN